MQFIEKVVLFVLAILTQITTLSENTMKEFLPLFSPSGLESFISLYPLALFSLSLAFFCFYFFDWLSYLSSFLKILFLQKKPSSFDEYFSLYLLIICLPVTLALAYQFELWTEIQNQMNEYIFIHFIVFSLMGVLLWIQEKRNRDRKYLYDLEWKDAVVFSLLSFFDLIPGVGRVLAFFLYGSWKEIRRDAVFKLLMLSYVPYGILYALQTSDQSFLSQVLNLHSSTLVSSSIFILSLVLMIFIIYWLRNQWKNLNYKRQMIARLALGITALCLMWKMGYVL